MRSERERKKKIKQKPPEKKKKGKGITEIKADVRKTHLREREKEAETVVGKRRLGELRRRCEIGRESRRRLCRLAGIQRRRSNHSDLRGETALLSIVRSLSIITYASLVSNHSPPSYSFASTGQPSHSLPPSLPVFHSNIFLFFFIFENSTSPPPTPTLPKTPLLNVCIQK